MLNADCSASSKSLKSLTTYWSCPPLSRYLLFTYSFSISNVLGKSTVTGGKLMGWCSGELTLDGNYPPTVSVRFARRSTHKMSYYGLTLQQAHPNFFRKLSTNP